MNEPLFTLKNRWFTISVAAVVIIAALYGVHLLERHVR